jgi:hypothetical protein
MGVIATEVVKKVKDKRAKIFIENFAAEMFYRFLKNLMRMILRTNNNKTSQCLKPQVCNTLANLSDLINSSANDQKWVETFQENILESFGKPGMNFLLVNKDIWMKNWESIIMHVFDR